MITPPISPRAPISSSPEPPTQKSRRKDDISGPDQHASGSTQPEEMKQISVVDPGPPANANYTPPQAPCNSHHFMEPMEPSTNLENGLIHGAPPLSLNGNCLQHAPQETGAMAVVDTAATQSSQSQIPRLLIRDEQAFARFDRLLANGQMESLFAFLRPISPYLNFPVLMDHINAPGPFDPTHRTIALTDLSITLVELDTLKSVVVFCAPELSPDQCDAICEDLVEVTNVLHKTVKLMAVQLTSPDFVQNLYNSLLFVNSELISYICRVIRGIINPKPC